MLRHTLLASVASIMLTGSVLAADLPSRAPPPVYLPPAPIFTWTGFYIGAQVGYAWGTSNGNIGDNFGDFSSLSVSNSGVIGGGHVGYNLQWNQFVIGLEGSVDGASLNKTFSGFVSENGVFPGFAPPVTVHSNVDVMGSVRGRLGYAWDRVLIYATGGVAFAGVNSSISTPFGFDSASSTRVGWTVGGGLEYAITNNWSIRAEYRYSDFGHTTVFASNSFNFPLLASVGAFANRHTTENQVQAGVSYKFDTFAPPAPIVAKY